MPTPQSTFFRPQSLSQEGLCKMNLRGAVLYDYADSTIAWTYTGTFTSAAAAGSQPWTYFVPRAMTIATTDTITRSSIFSQARNFTIMFRIYLDTLENPGSTGTSIFFNGTPASGGPPPPLAYFWGIYFAGSPPTPSSSQMRFTFFFTSGGSMQPPLTISSTFIEATRWYHIAVKVEYNAVSNKSSLYGFVDGVQTATLLNQNPLDTAVGATRIGYNTVANNAQSFKITELVYIEKALSNQQIAAYATSAFV